MITNCTVSLVFATSIGCVFNETITELNRKMIGESDSESLSPIISDSIYSNEGVVNVIDADVAYKS